MGETFANKENLTAEPFWAGTLPSSPVGPISVLVSSTGLAVVEFAAAKDFEKLLNIPIETAKKPPEILGLSLKQIGEYLQGKLRDFTLPVDLRGLTLFSQEILQSALQVAFGQVKTYGELAAAAGYPKAARAVGGVMSRNPIPIVVPCHRIVASDGTLHGFSAPGGLKTKSWLLELEGHKMKNLRLV
jgi:methylated-DNA-[protein]-cysteine S-methyltransferase